MGNTPDVPWIYSGNSSRWVTPLVRGEGLTLWVSLTVLWRIAAWELFTLCTVLALDSILDAPRSPDAPEYMHDSLGTPSTVALSPDTLDSALDNTLDDLGYTS